MPAIDMNVYDSTNGSPINTGATVTVTISLIDEFNNNLTSDSDVGVYVDMTSDFFEATYDSNKIEYRVSLTSITDGDIMYLAQCGGFSKTFTIHWAPPPTTITLTPDLTSGVAGSVVNITVTLKNNNSQLADYEGLRLFTGQQNITCTRVDTGTYTASVTNSVAGDVIYKAELGGTSSDNLQIAWISAISMTVTAVPGSQQIGGNVNISVEVTDSNNNKMVGAIVTVGSADLTTDNNGIATFVITESTSGKKTYTVSCYGLSNQYPTVTWTSDSTPIPAEMNVSANTESQSVGGTVNIDVYVIDNGEQPIVGAIVTLDSANVSTDGSGKATFTITENTPGNKTYTFICNTLSKVLNINWTPVPTTITLTSDVSSAVVNSSVIITATLQNSSGILANYQGLSLYQQGGDIPLDVTFTNIAIGTYTASVTNSLEIPITYEARVGPITGSLLINWIESPTRMDVSAPPLTQSVGGTVNITVTVFGNFNLPIPGVRVTLESYNATTNNSGVATFNVTEIVAEESKGYTVRCGDLSNNIYITWLNPGEILVSADTLTQSVGGTVNITVTVNDTLGDRLPGAPVTLGSDHRTTDIHGIATFPITEESGGTNNYLVTCGNLTNNILITWTSGTNGAPSMTLVAVPTTQQINNDVIITATVFGTNSQPLEGQSVSLDGGPEQLTNSLGKTVFTRRNSGAGIVQYLATSGNLAASATVTWIANGGPKPPCFLEGTKILCQIDGVDAYIPVEKLVPGTLVRTSLNGLKKIVLIGTGQIENPDNDERIEQRLYKLSPSKYPDLKDDLFITGCHSILVRNITYKQRCDTIKYVERVFVTDKKYRLMACVDENAEPWNSKGTYTIWHFALEHENVKMNYGVYANGGLLVETCCINRLQNKTNFTFYN